MMKEERALADTAWYKKALAAQGKEQFFSYNVLQETANGSAFSSVKLLRDPVKLRDYRPA